MDSFEWVIGVLTVVFGIAGIANNNKKKREEQASSAAGRKPPADAGRTRPAGGTFGRILEELSRELNEQPSPTVSPWPVSFPAARSAAGPEATAHDYYSLEEEYDAMDGSEWRGDYSAEDSDAESRYVGGEMGERRFSYEMEEDKTTARESLTARIASRSASPSRVVSAVESTADGAGEAEVLSSNPDAVHTPATLREVLGGDFDLRRAIIEAEILAPKYI